MEILTKAEQLALGIKLAVEAHDGQMDKSGRPYILHPLYVMNQVMFDYQLATIAILHDAVEDSALEIDNLYEYGFSHRVCVAVQLLTHDPAVPYEDYIENMMGNIDAIRVKRKDIEHNSGTTRLVSIEEKDQLRIKKYHKAFMRLGEAKEHFERR